MSIYRTGLRVRVPHPLDEPGSVEIICQHVPPWIDYTGEAWDWLPPPVEPKEPTDRAVVICGPHSHKGTARCGQEYLNPLLILSGAEYEAIGWAELWARLDDALRTHLWHWRTPIEERLAELEAELAALKYSGSGGRQSGRPPREEQP